MQTELSTPRDEMPSRKKNKGRERRAKKASAERGRWMSVVAWGQTNVHCNHGRTLSLPDQGREHECVEEPVYAFIDGLIRDTTSLQNVITALETLHQTHRDVWGNEKHRKHAVDLLAIMGTNLLLSDGCQGDCIPHTSFDCVYVQKPLLLWRTMSAVTLIVQSCLTQRWRGNCRACLTSATL